MSKQLKAKRLPFELVPNDDALPLFNLYHRRGILAAAQGVCWLVLAGGELQKLKKEVGHGNFEAAVKERCEYDVRTAQRYMALFDGVKNRALKTNTKPFLKLLEKNVTDLKRGEQEELVLSVMSLTDGETIQDLYLGFGIVKKPAAAGLRGAKRSHTASSSANDDDAEAKDLWEPHLNFLESDGLERKSWKDLPEDELKRLRSVVADLNKALPKKK